MQLNTKLYTITVLFFLVREMYWHCNSFISTYMPSIGNIHTELRNEPALNLHNSQIMADPVPVYCASHNYVISNKLCCIKQLPRIYALLQTYSCSTIYVKIRLDEDETPHFVKTVLGNAFLSFCSVLRWLSFRTISAEPHCPHESILRIGTLLHNGTWYIDFYMHVYCTNLFTSILHLTV